MQNESLIESPAVETELTDAEFEEQLLTQEQALEPETNVTVEPAVEPAVETTTNQPLSPADEIKALEAKLADLRAGTMTLEQKYLAALFPEGSQITAGVAKNHAASRVDTNRKYELLLDKLPMAGRVPQQQADIADILVRSFEVGKPFTEAEAFDAITKLAKQYPKLANSVQHPTYIFRYYRGLKPDGNHAGYIRRGFLRQIG